MKAAAQPPSERERLTALQRYQVLDTPAEASFDELARLAAALCGTPMAGVSLVDEHRQWFKARVGIPTQTTPRDDSFCAHAIQQTELWVLPDAIADPRFARNPLVQQTPAVRFYAATPLLTAEGYALGTLCVMDAVTRTLTATQGEALRLLARQVVAQLDLRRHLSQSEQDHRRTEDALQRSEAFYHSLVESLPQNIFRKDLDGRFTFANHRFCTTLGKPRVDVIGKTDFDFFPAELAAKYQQDDLRVIEQNCVFETVEAHQTPDQGTIYVQVMKSPLFDHRGRSVGIQGLFWDVTERKRMEEQLAHERDLLKALLDNVPDSIYYKDLQSRFTRWSRALAERLAPGRPEALAAKTDFDFFSAEHAGPAFEDEQRIIRNGEPVVGKTELETNPDGSSTWALTTKMPLRNQDGAIIGTFGISKDITALKQAESELEKARDAAVESARLKSEFLANMSHEIRTPMNAVIGMSGLLLDTELTTEQRDFGETIRTSADALLTIINDILDFSKVEAGKLVCETIDFDLKETVEGAVELLAERAQSKGLELVNWLHDTVPLHLRGDPGRLRQILTNLCGNAVKFTERGEVLVDVDTAEETETHAVLKFTVQDTGIGVPAKALPFLFQAFTQADGSMTRRYGGTGLGLAISKQLVELMGGQIGVESTPGKGSTFWFTVRLEKQPPRAATEPRNCERADLAGLRVLIVDDNATNRRILHHQIVAWKMNNGSAASGPEALEILRRQAALGQPYDLVLLDMQMPDMDGLTLARTITQDSTLTGVRMVMLTSMGNRLESAVLREAGIAACLVKPVKQSRLFDLLSTVMADRLLSPGPAHSRASDSPRPPAPAEFHPARGLRILLAEDNMVNQKVALRQLHKLGYGADAVANGYEVLAARETVPYDVILMDCQMPEMDGYEATRQLRQREQTNSLPPIHIIAMTANALQGDREKCLAAGMNDYVSKPVQMAELQAALQRAATKAGAPAPPAEPAPALPTLDRVVIDGLRDLREEGEPDPVQELTDLFFQDADERLRRMTEAHRAGKAAELAALAHGLKGSASNLGARQLAAWCSTIEKHALAGQLREATEPLRRAETEYLLVRAALARERRVGEPAAD